MKRIGLIFSLCACLLFVPVTSKAQIVEVTSAGLAVVNHNVFPVGLEVGLAAGPFEYLLLRYAPLWDAAKQADGTNIGGPAEQAYQSKRSWLQVWCATHLSFASTATVK